MEPARQKKSTFTEVELSETDDARLEEMKDKLYSIFQDAGGNTYMGTESGRERANTVANTVDVYTKVCAEQRRRAVIRANQPSAKKR